MHDHRGVIHSFHAYHAIPWLVKEDTYADGFLSNSREIYFSSVCLECFLMAVLIGASLPPAHRPHYSKSAPGLLARLLAGRLPLPLQRLAFCGWLWGMVGAFGLREIVARLAPAAVCRWLGSRQPFNYDLRSSSCPGAGLGGVLRWWLPMRLVWVRYL
ncbi:D-tyrosyl-tRNA(Tyr) deacylase [Striga asiatica]|uniref:D-tyrosyl-tRNA(Tyr) deacylase n=1 Tax=Striga asiatica TaxID=4170 RepID=A0A5A7P7L2_STRAF|nr:D-tyrosyl-tRNA(Tyr) deacylase [Striga asiatica]